ncbi:thioredoxin family protein [Anaplasmataceae bacterium AB001_6]|nr:thioredoxin family protein [Anaplasmataceae bacterium AB001_6]
MSEYVKFLSNQEDGELISNISSSAVIKISAEWCAPCQSYKPVFAKFASEYTNIDFYDVDISLSKYLSDKFDVNIMSVPFFIFVKNGTKVMEKVGSIKPDQFVQYIKILTIEK